MGFHTRGVIEAMSDVNLVYMTLSTIKLEGKFMLHISFNKLKVQYISLTVTVTAVIKVHRFPIIWKQ